MAVGDDKVGQILLLKLGYRTARERALLESELYKDAELQLQALTLMDKLIQNEGMEAKDAAAFLDQPAIRSKELAHKYKKELAVLLNLQAGPDRRLNEVTVFLRLRTVDPKAIKKPGIKPKPEALDSDGNLLPEFVGLPDWEQSDTEQLPEQLYQAIARVVQDEREGKDEEETQEKKT